MRSVFAWIVLASLLVPALASAQGQTCVLLPQPEDSSAPADAHDRASATITEELRSHGLVVMGSRDAQLRMTDQPVEHCAAIDCAPDVNRFLGTTFAVLTELTWLRGRPTMINIVLIGIDNGVSAGGQAVIERSDDLQAATRAAFSIAWDRWQADSQGQLSIETTPPNAFIEIDGTSVGHSPIRQLVRAGVHSVRASLEGYVADSREITVDRQQERTVSITLVAEGSTEPSEPVDTTVPPIEEAYRDDVSAWNFVIGAVAVLGGAAIGIEPVWTAATQGERTVHETSTDTVYFGPESIALAITSGVLVVGGIVFMIVHPITDRVRLGATANGLRLEGSF